MENFKRRLAGRGGGIGVGGGSAVEDCEARRDCSVTRRDEILSEKNEQNVSAIEGDGMEWRGRFAMKKRVNCSPKMSRVGRAGVNERRVVFLLCSNDKFMVSMGG